MKLNKIEIQLDNKDKQTESKWTLKEQPETLIRYDKLHCLEGAHIKYDKFSDFFLINPHGEMDYDEWVGWKLHISLLLDSAKEAFDLIVPVLCKYPVAFRVLDLDKTNSETHLAGSTRFTIYLEKNGQIMLSAKKARKLIEEVTALLVQHKMVPGKPLAADLKTFSPFFSMRNDKLQLLTLALSFDKQEQYQQMRFTAEDAKNCNNPMLLSNPFLSLLVNDSTFSLSKHYLSMPLNGLLHQQARAFALTLVANINRTIGLSLLSDPMFVYEMFSDDDQQLSYLSNYNLTKFEVNDLKYAVRYLCFHFEMNLIFFNQDLITSIRLAQHTSQFNELLSIVASKLKFQDYELTEFVFTEKQYPKWFQQKKAQWLDGFLKLKLMALKSRLVDTASATEVIDLLEEIAKNGEDYANLLLLKIYLKGELNIQFVKLTNDDFSPYVNYDRSLELAELLKDSFFGFDDRIIDYIYELKSQNRQAQP